MNNPVSRMRQEAEAFWSQLAPAWEFPLPPSSIALIVIILAIIAALSPWLWRVIAGIADLADFYRGLIFGSNSYHSSE
ncbi:MAG: hypothetical protein V4682_03110 [Patescibacteria group bacterium]